MNISHEWYEYAMQFEEDGQFLIFCEHCQQVFFIRKSIIQRFQHDRRFEEETWSLRDLDCMSICCKNPHWLFVTAYFNPTRNLQQGEEARNYLQVIRYEDQERLMWEEMLNDSER